MSSGSQPTPASIGDLALAALSAALGAAQTAWIVGGLNAPPGVHDEASNLLQAQLFAAGRLVGPTPPLPRFFDQFHVLVEPVYASKYPPLTALVMAPSVALGVPGLTPILLAAGSAALVYAITRHLADRAVAVCTTALFLSFGTGLTYGSTLLSHPISSCLWLLTLYSAAHGARGAGVAAGLGALFLTRPLTCVGLAPGTLWLLAQRRPLTRRDVTEGAAVLAVAVALFCGWNHLVTGSALTTPWSLYARQYFPGDHLGFGWNPTPPLLPYDDDRARLATYFHDTRAAYVPARLGAHAWLRLRGLWSAWFGSGAWGALVALGAVTAGTRRGRALRPLAAAWAGLFAVHLLFPHGPWLLKYYLEGDLVPALFAAMGLATLGRAVADAARWPPARVRWALGLTLLGALTLRQPARLRSARTARAEKTTTARAWRDKLAALPGERLIVFVRYAPDHNVHTALVTNEGDLAAARVWVVNERGAEDTALLAFAPDRAAWRYDEATDRFTPLTRAPTE